MQENIPGLYMNTKRCSLQQKDSLLLEVKNIFRNSFRKVLYQTIQVVTYFHVMQGSTGAHFMPSTSVSPIGIIPPMRHTHLLIQRRCYET
jgi:hypothetical protein